MTKIYFHKSNLLDSRKYIEYPLEDAKKIIDEALNDYRIVKDMKLDKRILNSSNIIEDDIIRVLPIVGGG